VYYGNTLAYDEGLARGDAILASALWRCVIKDHPTETNFYRNLFSSNENVDAQALTKMVRYIRHQLTVLDDLPDDDVLDAKWQFQ
jgi:cytochrome b pre-mRNA-processing protein 3